MRIDRPHTTRLELLRLLWATTWLTLAGALAPSGFAEEATSLAAAGTPSRSRLDLHDGTVLQGRLVLDEFELATGYGTLSIPLSDVYEVRMADRIDTELAGTITSLVAELGDASFEVREAAQRSLSGIGRRAVSALEAAAAATEDLEVRARLEELVADFEVEEGESFERPREEDEVLTRRFLARGRLALDVLLVETAYGELSISREHVKSILVQRPPRQTTRMNVEATTTVNSGFIESEVEVQPGDRIRIKASGSVFYEMWGTQFSPDGDPNYGVFAPGVPVGALVMRLGDDGPLTLVGASYDRVATRAGTLKLAIAINDRGRPATGGGEFAVRIVVEHEISELEER